MKQPSTHRKSNIQIILLAALIIVAAIILGLLGIEVAIGVTGWSQWLRDQASALFIWRLTLYSATVYGWYRMRRRFAYRESSLPQDPRLLYAEVAAVATIALLELLTFGSN